MKYKTVRGMQDFLPERARKKKYIEQVCREVFEKYGFSPLETPIIEELKLLTAKGSAGAEIEKEIYSFKDKGERSVGLRFDLTVPLARVVANNKQLKMPFKRYQIGRVFRYDRPQASRYRCFTQADIDIIGSESVLSEFELIAAVSEIMQKLKLDFYITVSSRELLENLALACGVKKEKLFDCFRAIDKVEKIGWSGVKKELAEYGIDSGIVSFVKENNLEKAKEKIKESNLSLKGIERIEELLNYLKEQDLSELVRVNLSLARGLEYYTGLVFEVKLKKGPSVGGGGRYDELIGLYGGKSLPATGVSLGIERLLDSIGSELKLKTESRILIIPVNESLNSKALDLTQRIRALGINSQVDLLNRSISKNISFADKSGIPFVIVLGERELKEKEFKLKELKTGKESSVELGELKELKELIKD